MLISPSIVSGDMLHLADEASFADQVFGHIHIDIEDGVAVPNITMGVALCKRICQQWPRSYRSIHLCVNNPLDYLERIRECGADIVFVKVGHLNNATETLVAYKEAGIPLGLSLSNVELTQNWLKWLSLCEQVIVVTNYVGDPKREFRQEMLEIALKIAKQGIPVWIDGNVTFDCWQTLAQSNLYAAVMGKAVFQSKEKARARYSSMHAEGRGDEQP